MLYVFHVDTGNMVIFDMNLALETVLILKGAIANKCGVSEDKQVLLISGGESLNDDARVCSYSAAGTDTSPIFLFSKSTIESSVPPQPKVDYGVDFDMKERVESCLDMEPAINTVVARAELANQLHEMATQQLNVCEKLVHDQHLQHQGWRAVVANLEDIAVDFGESVTVLNKNFSEFSENRTHYIALLNSFDEDLKLLSNIPLLPNLIDTKKESKSGNCLSLLQWISQKDEQSSLEQVAEQCLRSLEQFDESSLQKIEEEVKQTLESVNNRDMKEIRGLEERLSGLEKLMYQAKKLVSEQSDLSQALYQNQQRASNLRDPSIFPDLCKSHQKQLQLMLHNHQQLRDIRRRCVNAKRELSENLHLRLRWIMFVEKKLTDVDSKIMIYRENLRRLQRHLKIIEQVNLAPKVYIACVCEVVRRQQFSQNFMNWSEELVKHVTSSYSDEVSRRHTFAAEYSGHFLRNLFPGMGDIPPPFATEPPKPFDVQLPNIGMNDLKMLKDSLPQLSHLIELPSNVPFPNFVPEVTSKAKEEELKAFKASLQAEKQIIFNETLSQITKEKDDSILTLKASERKLLSTLESISANVARLKNHVKGTETLQVLETIEKLIASPTSTEQAESMLESFVDLPACVSEKDTIFELQNTVKSRDFEISKLQQKISELSITGSTIGQTDRVAVLSCEAGDIVLLCYDERYESYIVFTLNPVLHFVHTESVEALKLNSGPGEAPRSWALAEITDKEYCQAKKAQNRYNVPVNTRFYRVKAKSWNKGNVLRRGGGDIAQSAAFASAISSETTVSDPTQKMANSCIPNISDK
ncbi:RB1-inducible coiled-coil protein 1-like protein [Leptotrombidium deliense]|uniref:RB1-inducible coiled-coil protein 1 n=1 Tax=Leptotrombidium deliense TaxID=299467 RepID=A0A443SH05_9ACAR|nr:RB1-inducible coiled-coil protein 1-like protein [Leptotrombidium deliense]